MEYNIIPVRFGCSKEKTVSGKWRIDYGQKLHFEDIDLPEYFECHVCNSGDTEAQRIIGVDGYLDIPNSYFGTGLDIECYLYYHTGDHDGETVRKVTILVEDRPDVIPAEPVPEQEDIIAQAIVALNAGVAEAEEQAENAEAWASGTRDGVDVEYPDPAYRNNARYWADAAEQAASTAGYMFFWIDENGDLIFERTPNTEVDFAIIGGDLYVGVIE